MRFYICLLFGLLSVSCVFAQDATYDVSTKRVFIPSVRIGDNYFARVVMELDESNRFYLIRYDEASEEENEALSRIDPKNCFNAHPLAKLQASEYFGDPDKSLCLKFFQGTGTEGGDIISYLLIESGKGTLVSDNRQVGFSACCLEIYENVTGVSAGQTISGQFVPWNSIDPIDINANYILRVELSGTFQIDL